MIEEVEDLLGRQEKEDELLFHEDNEWTQKAIKGYAPARESSMAWLGRGGDVDDGGIIQPAAEARRQDFT